MNRFIVVNPVHGFIQGDIMCASPAGAVETLERNLTAGTNNPTWDVYRAPVGFPAPGETYSGLDVALVSALCACAPVQSVANRRRAAETMSLAS